MAQTKIYENYSAFLNRTDKSENGVSEEFAESYPKWESMNKTNEACWNCRGCIDCIDKKGEEDSVTS